MLREVAAGCTRFANGIIGAVMAGWMIGVIVLVRGPFLAGQPCAWPRAGWSLIDTAVSSGHGV